jgi:SAM-dependent methyltransferase
MDRKSTREPTPRSRDNYSPPMASPHPITARLYDWFMVPSDRLGLRGQRARLCGPAAGRVLDLGVGTGLNLTHYPEETEVIGIDLDQAMLHKAISRSWESPATCRLVAADALALPFPDQSFDQAVIAFGLCTVPEPDIALLELYRVTRVGGELRFLEHTRSPRAGRARFQDRIAPVWRRLSGGCRINQDTMPIIESSPWTVTDLWTAPNERLVQGTAVRPG